MSPTNPARAATARVSPADDATASEQRRKREEQRQQIRQRTTEPILSELKKWLDEQRAKVLPKSLLGQAIGYALNNWQAVARYTEEGYLAIDNNLSERTLRAIALGRNYADLPIMRSRGVLHLLFGVLPLATGGHTET